MYRRWQNQITRIYFPLLQLRWACVTATERCSKGCWTTASLRTLAYSVMCWIKLMPRAGRSWRSLKAPGSNYFKRKICCFNNITSSIFLHKHGRSLCFFFFCRIASNHLRKVMLKGFVLQHTAQCKAQNPFPVCFVFKWRNSCRCNQ